MKLIIIISLILMLFCGNALACETVVAEIPVYLDTPAIERQIFDVMKPVNIINVTDGWKIKGMHFNSTIKNRANSFKTWGYEESGKTISFMHQKTKWDTGAVIAVGAIPAIGIINKETKPVEVFYDDAIKEGINVKIVQDNYRWQKIIEIESLESLGKIPINAKHLEISFEVSGDFVLSDGIINEPIPFGENSYLQPVRTWDSSEDIDKTKCESIGIVDGNIITKRIPVEWLKSATYPVQTDLTITYGAENVFNLAITDYISVATLDSTHFVVAYTDAGNSNYGTAIVGEISGATISSYGAENVFNSASTSYLSVAALDSTHFVVGYSDSGNSNYGTAIVGEISGTTISSYGVENVFNSAVTNPISVAALDSTHFVVGYRDDGGADFGCAKVGVVSGTTISSYGAENVFNSAVTNHISVDALDSTHFVVGYRDDGNSNYGTAIVGEISGTTISSYGAENVFNSATTYYISVATLDSTHFVVGYSDVSNSIYGTGIVGEVSGTTISSYGAENVFNSASTSYPSVASFDSTHFVVGYRDDGNSQYGTAIVGEISGTTISSYGAENVFNSAVTNHISVAALNSTHFVVGYRDDGNSNYGTAIVGEIPEVIPTDVIISLHSSSPCCIFTNYTGVITGNYIVESNYPLNYSSLAFLMGVNYTPTSDMHSYLKVPSNTIASDGIYRAHNRNTTPFMSWENNTTITEDNVWQWSGGDNDSFWISKEIINDTHTWINMTGIASNVFPSMFYLGRQAIYAAPKTGIEINQHQGIIIKLFDLEGYRGRNNDYYISMYPDTQLESTTPTENIDIWYCNNSFAPLVDDPTTCPYCVRTDTWDYNRWMDHEDWQPHTNVSYAKPLTAYADTYPEIPPDEVMYLYFASDTLTSKSYVLNATNHDPGICNITYAQTNTMWTYNELSDTSTAIAYTPSFYATFVRDYEEFLHHLYIANDQGVWGHSDIYNISIGVSDVPPTYCHYNYYWWDNTTDYNMNGSYTDNFWINLTYGFDPDNGVALTHVLSLYDTDYNFVAFVNDSLIGNATDVDIFVDISEYNPGDYMFKIVSTDNEGSTSVTWSKEFTLVSKNSFWQSIKIIQGFPTAIGNILSTFLSFLPLLVGILISGFILIVSVSVFSKFKRW